MAADAIFFKTKIITMGENIKAKNSADLRYCVTWIKYQMHSNREWLSGRWTSDKDFCFVINSYRYASHLLQSQNLFRHRCLYQAQ